MSENEAVPEGPVAEILSELRAANSAHGEAKAFVHVAGYAFKLGFDKLKWLLKDQRWRQCGFDTIEAFAENIQFGPSMKAAAAERKELAALFKEADEARPLSNRKIAIALNVSHTRVNKDFGNKFPPYEKNLNENKVGKDIGGNLFPPTLPSGEQAGKLVAAREGRKARDAAADLPFKATTGQRLMAVARDQRLANAAQCAAFPPHWATLYELTKLDDESFQSLLAAGVIRPDMERKDVAGFVKKKLRAQREQALGAAIRALPEKRYGVILADPEWLAWKAMRQRCNNPNDRAFKNYGARGIAVCKRWDSFESFFSDLGPKPDPILVLDRIDNDGNYEPGNCRWTTPKISTHNRRSIKRNDSGVTARQEQV
jgi:hypothetical protein